MQWFIFNEKNRAFHGLKCLIFRISSYNNIIKAINKSDSTKNIIIWLYKNDCQEYKLMLFKFGMPFFKFDIASQLISSILWCL